MIYVVTGESRVTQRQAMWVAEQINELQDVGMMITGAAKGVDTVALLEGLASHPDADHIVCVPAAPYNDALDGYLAFQNADRTLAPSVEVTTAQRGRSDSESYMLRNDLMVRRAVEEAAGLDHITCLGFPYTPVERLRSGSWATIRRARRAGITNIDVRPL